MAVGSEVQNSLEVKQQRVRSHFLLLLLLLLVVVAPQQSKR